MKEELLAAGMALLVWALSLVMRWRTLKSPNGGKVRLGKGFICWGLLILAAGLALAVIPGTLADARASASVGVMLGGFGMFIEGLLQKRRELGLSVAKIREGLGWGGLMATIAGVVCVAIALWKFLAGS